MDASPSSLERDPRVEQQRRQIARAPRACCLRRLRDAAPAILRACPLHVRPAGSPRCSGRQSHRPAQGTIGQDEIVAVPAQSSCRPGAWQARGPRDRRWCSDSDAAHWRRLVHGPTARRGSAGSAGSPRRARLREGPPASPSDARGRLRRRARSAGPSCGSRVARQGADADRRGERQPADSVVLVLASARYSRLPSASRRMPPDRLGGVGLSLSRLSLSTMRIAGLPGLLMAGPRSYGSGGRAGARVVAAGESARLWCRRPSAARNRVSDPLAAAASRNAAQASASDRMWCATYLARRQATPNSCSLRSLVNAASASAPACKSCECLTPHTAVVCGKGSRRVHGQRHAALPGAGA